MVYMTLKLSRLFGHFWSAWFTWLIQWKTISQQTFLAWSWPKKHFLWLQFLLSHPLFLIHEVTMSGPDLVFWCSQLTWMLRAQRTEARLCPAHAHSCSFCWSIPFPYLLLCLSAPPVSISRKLQVGLQSNWMLCSLWWPEVCFYKQRSWWRVRKKPRKYTPLLLGLSLLGKFLSENLSHLRPT